MPKVGLRVKSRHPNSIGYCTVGRVLDMRQVASGFRIVRAVWTNNYYAALFTHFSQVSHNDGLDGKEKAQFKVLASKLSTSAFLLNFSIDAHDAL